VSHPTTAREALLAEVIGDVAKLIARLEAIAPVVDEGCGALEQARTSLRQDLANFEQRIAVFTESAKSQAMRQVALRVDEAARRSLEAQSRAMADAARIAFGAELGATVQRLHVVLRPLFDDRRRPWERWLTHAATAMASALATSLLMVMLGHWR
jgi:hypothetical protein